MDSELPEEVRKFEEFLEERLKPRLLNAIAQRDMVFEKQKIFSDLRKNIENMEKNTVTSMRMLVNLGSEIYTEAEAPETRSIFVEVGYGFYVEFTWSEALNYIDAREKLLSRKALERMMAMGLWMLASHSVDHSTERHLGGWDLLRQIEDHTRTVALLKAEIGLILRDIGELLKHSH